MRDVIEQAVRPFRSSLDQQGVAYRVEGRTGTEHVLGNGHVGAGPVAIAASRDWADFLTEEERDRVHEIVPVHAYDHMVEPLTRACWVRMPAQDKPMLIKIH